jgi:hypothetical protein
MSARNGDRARFHKDRKRRVRQRQRVKALIKTLGSETKTAPAQAKTAGRP